MSTPHSVSNAQLNSQLAQLQAKANKISAHQQVAANELKKARDRAIQIFGTDDVEQVRRQVEAIHARNQKVIGLKQTAVSIVNQALSYIDNSEAVPESVINQLTQINTGLRNAIDKQRKSSEF